MLAKWLNVNRNYIYIYIYIYIHTHCIYKQQRYGKPGPGTTHCITGFVLLILEKIPESEFCDSYRRPIRRLRHDDAMTPRGPPPGDT